MQTERNEYDLAQWLSWMEQSHPTEIDLGLDRIRQVAGRLSLDFGSAKVVTVAGTNGKGSTQKMLESVLAGNGHRVGCYSSPHFIHYNERVRLCGHNATDEQLCAAFRAIDRARGEISLTYFEIGTLAGFWLFAQQPLDYIILEVGLGGRLDAVNLIDADLAIVTSIGLDHVDWLGDCLEQIGREKAGVFRGGRPAVCGDDTPPKSIAAYAGEIGAEFYQVRDQFDYQTGETHWQWQGVDAEGGKLQREGLELPILPLPNAATVLQVLALLGELPTAEQLNNTLSSAAMTGRMQREVWQGKQFILDVAHNPHAADYLVKRFQNTSIAGQRKLLLGMLKDKDVAEVVRILAPVFSEFFLVDLDGPRGASADELATELEPLTKVSVHRYASVKEALQSAAATSSAQDEVLVAGSFLTVAAALSEMGKEG